MSANNKRLSLRLLALGVSSTAVLLFTSFLAVPSIRSGPYPGAEEVAAASVAPAAMEQPGADAAGSADVLEAGVPAEAIADAADALLLDSYRSAIADVEAALSDAAPSASAEAASGSSTSAPSTTRSSAPSRASSSSTGRSTRAVTFRDQQLAFPRVARAFDRKSSRVSSLFRSKQIARPAELFIRVFKREQELEVWARPPGATRFTHLTTYPVCKISGRLGPKRRSGDGQIPEGFYAIDLFNPWSSYHLSMRVNYPNAVDAARGKRGSLGGNIFVHGGCATIGCVPITDSYIEELYVMAVEARSAGQRRIPIHIFPTRLDDEGMDYLRTFYGGDFVDFPLWQKLEEGYRAFQSTRMLPRIRTTGGRYTVIPATGSTVPGDR